MDLYGGAVTREKGKNTAASIRGRQAGRTRTAATPMAARQGTRRAKQ